MGNAAIQERMDLRKRIELVTQEAEMTKANLSSQLSQKISYYENKLNSTKKQMMLDFEQQLQAVKETLE